MAERKMLLIHMCCIVFNTGAQKRLRELRKSKRKKLFIRAGATSNQTLSREKERGRKREGEGERGAERERVKERERERVCV
jgi:hypothetical protein